MRGLLTRPSYLPKFTPKPNDGCVLWLPGQDDAYSQTIRDRSGKANHGSLNGPVWERLSSGIWAPYFDGTDDFIDLGTDDSLDLGEVFTLECWVCCPALSTHQIFSRTNGANGYMVYVSSGGSLGMACYPNLVTASSDACVTSSPFHMVVAHTDGAAAFYINGADRTSSSGCDNPGSSTGLHLYMGKFIDAGLNWMVGHLALPRVYKDIAMTLTQAAGHFNNERHLFGV